jgi:holo-[acyl-carrier protein] synthase
MMILGLGTDIVEIARIAAAYQRWGDAFLNRLLLPGEIAYCQSYRNAAPHIAVRFAAKEAIAKAFGTGIGSELGWHDLEITREAGGRPFVRLHGGGLTLFAARGARQLHLTLSHAQQYATATAIVEGQP